MPKKIWLVEPNKLLRSMLKSLIASEQFEVTGEFGSLDQIAALSEGTPPSVILASLRTPLESDSEERALLKSVCERFTPAKLVVLAEEMSLAQMISALRAGASGYLLTDMSADVLQQSLVLVSLGEKVLPTQTVQELLSLPISERRGGPNLKMSEQEENVLKHLALGSPNKIIAHKLDITEGTVKVHMKSVLRKIGAQNRTQAAVWAMSHFPQGTGCTR